MEPELNMKCLANLSEKVISGYRISSNNSHYNIELVCIFFPLRTCVHVHFLISSLALKFSPVPQFESTYYYSLLFNTQGIENPLPGD